jgi:hypothetical protein
MNDCPMRRAGDRQIEELKRFSRRRESTLADDLDILIGDLCRLWGFCNQLSGEDLLSDDVPLTADRFAAAVLAAEGFPETDWIWRPRLQRVFTLRYGETVSVDDYSKGQ